jgi:hypothetical protein
MNSIRHPARVAVLASTTYTMGTAYRLRAIRPPDGARRADHSPPVNR